MDNWRNNTIWFEDIPDTLQAYFNLNKVKYNGEELGDIEYLTMWHHKSKLRNLDNLKLLSEFPNLIY